MAASGKNLQSVPIGIDFDWPQQIFSGGNRPIVFEGTEALSVSLWEGNTQRNISGVLTASWTNGAPQNGVCVMSVAGAATVGMTPEFYLWRIDVTQANGRIYSAAKGWLRLEESPGSASAPLVYCSLQNMIEYGGEWITGHMIDTGYASFISERVRAKRWLDRVILATQRPFAYTLADYFVAGYASANYAAELPDQFIAGLLAGGSGAKATATPVDGAITSIAVTNGGTNYIAVPPITIADPTGSGATATASVSGGHVTGITVNSGGAGYTFPGFSFNGLSLMLTDDLIECVSYKALQFVCERAFSWGTNDNDTYHLRADKFGLMASNMCCTFIASFDVNNDGRPDVAGNMGRFSIR